MKTYWLCEVLPRETPMYWTGGIRHTVETFDAYSAYKSTDKKVMQMFCDFLNKVWPMTYPAAWRVVEHGFES